MIANDFERVPYDRETHRGSVRTSKSYSQRGTTLNEAVASRAVAHFSASTPISRPVSKLKKTSKKCEPFPLNISRIVQDLFRLSSVTIRRCVTGEARRR